jgi:acetyl esterase/lipase
MAHRVEKSHPSYKPDLVQAEVPAKDSMRVLLYTWESGHAAYSISVVALLALHLLYRLVTFLSELVQRSSRRRTIGAACLFQEEDSVRSLWGWMFALLFSASAAAQVGPPPGMPPGPPPAQMKPAEIPKGVKQISDIPFAERGGRALKLDLFLPEKPQGALPVVVWIFGGAFTMNNQKQQEGTAAWLALHGYAVAAIEYRLSGEAVFPAQIEDCKEAVRWLRANAAKYGLDARRIGAWGASSGGHLAAMLGTSGDVKEFENGGSAAESSRVAAVVDFFGPTDFLQMDAHALPGGMRHDPPDSPESRLVGGAIQQNREKVQRANPMTYVSSDDPPFLICHGEQDTLVPLHQSELLFEALKASGVNVTFYKIAGAGHGGPAFESPMIRAAVLAFFEQHLKK